MLKSLFPSPFFINCVALAAKLQTIVGKLNLDLGIVKNVIEKTHEFYCT